MPPDAATIVLASNTYEGGGGLIRDAISFVSILGKPIRLENIRANRPGTGGLRSEHTVAIRTIARLCAARTSGNETASRTLEFYPHQQACANEGVREVLDVEVEGSAVILLLALLPVVLFSRLGNVNEKSRTIIENGLNIKIHGGTLCIKAPSIHYLQHVIMPTFHRIGFVDNIHLDSAYDQGWHTDFAKSPGLLSCSVKPLNSSLPAFVFLSRGDVSCIRAIGHSPVDQVGVFQNILETEIQRAFGTTSLPKERPQFLIEVNVSNQPSQYHLLLVAQCEDPPAFLGYEQVYPQVHGFPKNLESNNETLLLHLTRVCIQGLIQELQTGNSSDTHLQDMLVIYQSLADGFSSVILGERNDHKEIPKDVSYFGNVDYTIPQWSLLMTS
ncbi:EPT/RTPC-like protein [Zopfia rhizophila CBS 207.26]|uniref:EPT/RTPC-like protein n=1 Tax=Zopfia rhizophila CBS 207.26 TaxID=1314779 RepID=A0A6A6DDC0_9PEZI|nr:EPT/RTPC-like protein [Zopfia rhizophila CBS 207.26]